ncbi:unnamed protein product [Albugo candida]|uniref:Uncharacterized protein n=1 Tax=Albugo candida TaxID=65357 RepID=A0A024GI78_9STRA|nr:unnamed protein product [Albugo candida]|eukprot:CCI46455.1 unnamed protein product [Albugo candida]
MHDLLASDNVEKMCLHSVYILFDSIAASHVLEKFASFLWSTFKAVGALKLLLIDECLRSQSLYLYLPPANTRYGYKAGKKSCVYFSYIRAGNTNNVKYFQLRCFIYDVCLMG